MTDFSQLKRLAYRAADLMQDEEFKLLLAYLKDAAIFHWSNSRPNEAQEREGYWRDLQAVCRLEEHLKSLPGEVQLQQTKLDEKYGRK